MAEQQISLVGGDKLVVIEEEWPALATASYGTLLGGAYLIARLAVRRHDDGRTLIHLKERVGGKSTHSGVLLGEGTSEELKQACRALVEQRDLPASLADECLAAL